MVWRQDACTILADARTAPVTTGAAYASMHAVVALIENPRAPPRSVVTHGGLEGHVCLDDLGPEGDEIFITGCWVDYDGHSDKNLVAPIQIQGVIGWVRVGVHIGSVRDVGL